MNILYHQKNNKLGICQVQFLFQALMHILYMYCRNINLRIPIRKLKNQFLKAVLTNYSTVFKSCGCYKIDWDNFTLSP